MDPVTAPPPPSPTPYGNRSGARTTQRRGRMSDAKRTTLATLGPTWMLDPDATQSAADLGATGLVQELDRAFGRTAPRMLDIGVGNGEATVAWARQHPDHDVLAVELHRPGIARLLADGHAQGLTNVRILEADVTQILDLDAPSPPTGGGRGAGCPSGEITFAQVRVLFPDPWPKKRHVRRRLVDVAFVRRATDLLAVGGTLHLATDWPPYAEQMRAVIAAEPRLRPQVDFTSTGADHDGGTGEGGEGEWGSHRPDRPITAYEQRGLDAGRPITDLVAHRTR